jgi:hypothetical protein
LAPACWKSVGFRLFREFLLVQAAVNFGFGHFRVLFNYTASLRVAAPRVFRFQATKATEIKSLVIPCQGDGRGRAG